MVLASFFGNQVAKPLVGQLVGVYVYVVSVIKARGIHHKGLGKNCEGRIFHSRIQKIADGDLFVVLPRIRHADFSFQKVKNLFTVTVRGFYF